jgi:NAD(P)-dependent dehydrogenase (short-subunit alcohol dehydrogenase family)
VTSGFLAGKICLVTGGAEGIGWATVQSLANYGGDVYVCDISTENLATAQKELQETPWQEQIHFAQCDVAKRAEVESWIADIYSRTGHIDVLVNNAAFIRWESVDAMPEGIIQTLRTRKSTLDIPGYLPTMYLIFALMPNVFRWLVNLGGSGQRDYSTIKWRYKSK